MTLITRIPTSRPTPQSQWWYDTATGSEPELFCYSSEPSLEHGAPLELRIHTTAARYDVEIFRDDREGAVAYRAEGLRGEAHETHPAPYRNGCGWPVTLSVDTTPWQPGAYVIVCSASVGDVRLRHRHWVAIRPPRLSRDRITLIAATSTWAAYNGWGGSSHYYGIDGPEGDEFSPVLSFERPLQAGTVWVPPGAPRCANPRREPGTHVYYDDLNWAYGHAYAKHYSSAGWAMFERHFVHWAELHGYDVDVLTQHDLHFRPQLLDDAGPLVFVGHDEYWTWDMRDHVHEFVDRGGQVVRLAGNFMWQIRLSDDGAAQVCYKGRAPSEDPVRCDPEHRHLLTYAWDHATVGYPGAQTFGCTGSRGIYVATGGLAPRGSAGFTIYRPQHWMLRDTDAHYGDVLGSESRVAAYELDGLDYVVRSGLPYASGADGIDPDSVEIVGLCVCSNVEIDNTDPDAELDMGAADAAEIAAILYGEITEETLDKASRGCGLMCEYRRGKGRVVSAASAEWVNGLRLRDSQVEQVTRNMLDQTLSASGHD